jgi:hypothetical protein
VSTTPDEAIGVRLSYVHEIPHRPGALVFGSGDPTPFDFPLLALFAILAIVLIAGAVAGAGWDPGIATSVRRGGVVLAACALVAVLVMTPTRNGIVGAGRMLTIFPAFAVVVLTFLAWSWRTGRL